jgi:hypothetical protein
MQLADKEFIVQYPIGDGLLGLTKVPNAQIAKAIQRLLNLYPHLDITPIEQLLRIIEATVNDPKQWHIRARPESAPATLSTDSADSADSIPVANKLAAVAVEISKWSYQGWAYNYERVAKELVNLSEQVRGRDAEAAKLQQQCNEYYETTQGLRQEIARLQDTVQRANEQYKVLQTAFGRMCVNTRDAIKILQQELK